MIRDINLNLDCCDIDLVADFWKAALDYVEVAAVDQCRVLAPPAQPEGRGVLPGPTGCAGREPVMHSQVLFRRLRLRNTPTATLEAPPTGAAS